jgi:hypothetical protein
MKLSVLLIIVYTGLHYPQLLRWSTLRVNDDQSGLGAVTTAVFMVASRPSLPHALRTRKVAAEALRVAPLLTQRQPPNKIPLDVTSHRHKIWQQ